MAEVGSLHLNLLQVVPKQIAEQRNNRETAEQIASTDESRTRVVRATLLFRLSSAGDYLKQSKHVVEQIRRLQNSQISLVNVI